MTQFQSSRYPVLQSSSDRDRSIVDDIFAVSNLNKLSVEISNRLTNSRSDGKETVVPSNTIHDVLESFYLATPNNLRFAYERTINHIVDAVESEYAKEYLAKTRDINILMNNQEFGLSRHPQIKLKTTNPTRPQWEPRY